MIDRRAMLGALAAGSIGAAAPAWAAAPRSFTMWKDPGCGCCSAWASRVEAAFGRKLAVVKSPNMAGVKAAQGVPASLQSCHTALIDGVVVEGHVPPEDIKRLLAERPAGVKGLAVPGMPAGSPGMDVGHNHRQPYQVMAFDAAGKATVFASHR